MKKLLPLSIALATLTMGSAHGATIIFGSANEGYGGFTDGVTNPTLVPTPTPAPAWSLTTTGARFTNDPTTDSGQVNGSLLKQYTFDRISGNSYTITGIVNLISTYAADNNRVGISLFSTTNDLTGIDTGLSLQVNVGSGTGLIRILNGINNSTALVSSGLSGVTGTDLIGETLNFTAEIDFVGTDINVAFTLSAESLSYTQTISTTVAAASFTGDYFGFGSRGRERNTTPGTNDIPMIYEATSFSVIPEPSSTLLAGLFGSLCLLRRRR